MKNIGKIVLLVLGVALIALSAKALMEVPGQQAALESAVYLDEAVVLPENEGKLVIIHGVPEMIGPAYDAELKITIDSIKAYRYKETYKQTGFTDDETKWEWVSGGQTSLVGEAKIGEFELDEGILISFPAESDFTDFDAAEVRDYVLTYKSVALGEVVVLPDGGYYADTQTTYVGDSYFNWIGSNYVAEQLEGKAAYRYKYYNPEKNGEHTVVGIQQGNRLVKADSVGTAVFSGVKTQEQVLSTSNGYLIGGAAAFLVFGAVLVFLGIRKPHAKAKAKEA
ncbi:MAG: hypothetical protein IJA83_02590 [Clostridia bacterium]|nr:hypothetical protein [Clostridia bacterium]